MLRNLLLTIATLFLTVLPALGQSQSVTFRYVPTINDPAVRVFTPGEFNGWGPNSSGRIATDAPSLMTYVDSLEQYIYTANLSVGQTYEYKIHFHLNDSGSNNEWISDPLNERVNPDAFNNSVVTITDPMIFQPATELDANGLIAAVSAGVFTTSAFQEMTFWVNGIERDAMPYHDPTSGVLRFKLDRPIKAGSQFKVRVTDTSGRQDSVEVGEILKPVNWSVPSFTTVRESYTVQGLISRQDGTIDSSVVEAMLVTPAGEEVIDVENGTLETTVDLAMGANTFVIKADVDGEVFESDSLTVERRLHPLEWVFFESNVSGTSNNVFVTLSETTLGGDGLSYTWSLDETTSTADVISSSFTGEMATVSVAGAGEVYFDVVAEREDGEEDRARIAAVIDEAGNATAIEYEDIPGWVRNAVVYEIFPLSFGPKASGSPSAPGNKFNEITEELPYIAQMGFNVIWFMPIFVNQEMSEVSGGYNIVDFYNVDPTLGTNEDFKALVDRAHELGIRVILDITPSHVSPGHPWVDSLKTYGPSVPPASFLQTTPSSHNRGLDNRGANLAEIWQSGAGSSMLYRKYDGFGDLANVDWDDDDLQAEMLDIFAHWVQEYGIDGWRIDVYWGPWRRYGPDRFGRPLREHLKRIKPDQWILGEIVGTGFDTEVYYADDDAGRPVAGGLDAGYDWPFFWDVVHNYASLGLYDDKAKNFGFWPGPNARYFRFLENHDEERIGQRFSSTPDRIKPLTGYLLTIPGLPMIYQGQEVNFGDVSGWPARTPVSWNTERNGEFARLHQQLVQARRQFPAFGTQDLVTLGTDQTVYRFVRPYLDENAVVLVNFSSQARNITINPTSAVQTTTDGPIVYHHIFADSSFTDSELDGFEMPLAPYETVVLIANGGQEVNYELPELPALPFGAMYTNTESVDLSRPIGAYLEANYPNPFANETTITFSTEAGPVHIEVFNLLGQRIKTLTNQVWPSGRHTLVWEPGDIPNGMYFIRLTAGGQVDTRQVVKLD